MYQDIKFLITHNTRKSLPCLISLDIFSDILRRQVLYNRLCNQNKKTGVTSGAGTTYPLRAPEFYPGFQWGSCCSIFCYCVLLCISLFVHFVPLLLAIVLFVLLSLSFWLLCCLSFCPSPFGYCVVCLFVLLLLAIVLFVFLSLSFWLLCCLSFCPSPFGYCVVCPFVPLLLTIVLFVLLSLSFWLLCCLSFCPSPFDYCVVCPFVPLLLTIVLFVLLSLSFWLLCYLSFCPSPFGYCVVCPFVPLLLAIVLFVLRITDLHYHSSCSQT